MSLNISVYRKVNNTILPLIVNNINITCSCILKDRIPKSDEEMYSLFRERESIDKIIDTIVKVTNKVAINCGDFIINTIHELANKESNNALSWYVRADNEFTGMESHYYYEQPRMSTYSEPSRYILIERAVYDVVFGYIGKVYIPVISELWYL